LLVLAVLLPLVTVVLVVQLQPLSVKVSYLAQLVLALPTPKVVRVVLVQLLVVLVALLMSSSSELTQPKLSLSQNLMVAVL